MAANQTDAPIARRAERLKILSDATLLGVQKPAQYVGGEQNSVVKQDDEVDLHLALCFPDAYEVGMSHLGIQILYEIINADPRAWAERAFMPLPDMERVLRDGALPLGSLESARPLSNFDVVGFSLQYELCATNILAMLDLGGIPLLSAERHGAEPLIIGGGPYSYHPEPLAPFFDAFLLGDAEEAISDIMAVVREHKRSGESRQSLLRRLHVLDGVYVPAFFEPQYDEQGHLQEIRPLDAEKPMVTRRLLPTLEGAPYASRPIVPSIKTVHNRLSLEVMRGCVRGCRFCQAGYLYRPQRERSPEEILEMIETSLPATGFEELSLLSLSTADYCSIVPLLKTLMDRYGEGERLAISFPSTRVDALTPEVLEQVQRVRRTGFTVAPEAGTQRLRDVINKGVSDEEILTTCGNVFRMGWTGIKLYFMLGNPTETDEDLQGIINIAQRIKALPEARGKDITVSVSTLVPKPHTPFQWAAQISSEETIRKQRLLSQGLKRLRINFRYHDAFSSFLEGVFCRGDRRLAAVIMRAYQLGARLDAWTEHVSEERWQQAFLECGIDPLYYLRERDTNETLPWDHLSCGISKEYFRKEYLRALRDKPTPDCLTKSCSICGACDYDVAKNVLWPRAESEQALRAIRLDSPGTESVPAEPVQRVRIRYSKCGAARFIGHLELAQVIQRAIRRAALPIAYSLGFHPMPRVAFGPPLQLGVASDTEYADLFLVERCEPALLAEFLNQTLPIDYRVTEAREVPLQAPSLQEQIVAQRFAVRLNGDASGLLGPCLEQPDPTAALNGAVADFVLRREGDGRNQPKAFPLVEFVSDLKVHAPAEGTIAVSFTLRTDPKKASPRPVEIASAFTGLRIGDYTIEKIASELAETHRANGTKSQRLIFQSVEAATNV